MKDLFFFKGKRNRKYYFLTMLVVNFFAMLLFDLFNKADRYFIGNILFFVTEESTLSLLSDIVAGFCLFGFMNAAWILFCNKMKRAHDIGISSGIIVFIELVRYYFILKAFFILPVIDGDVIHPYPIITTTYRIWAYGMPIILGIIPANFKLQNLIDKTKVKKKNKGEKQE